MKEYNVTVREISTYGVCVCAASKEEAEEKALSRYGYDGEVEYCDVIVIDMEES